MNFTDMQLLSPARMLIAGFVCTFAILMPPPALADEVVLQDGKLLVAFDSDSGALMRLENGTTPWVGERHPELSVPFRLNVFSPDQKHDFVYREKHHAVE